MPQCGNSSFLLELRKQKARRRQEVYQRDALMSSTIYQSLLQALISCDLIWQMHWEGETSSDKTFDYVCQWIIQRQCQKFPSNNDWTSDPLWWVTHGLWPGRGQTRSDSWLLGSQDNNSYSLHCDAFSKPWIPADVGLWHPAASYSAGSVSEAWSEFTAVPFFFDFCASCS